MRKGVHFIFILIFLAGLMTACSKSGSSTEDGGGGGGPHIVTDNDISPVRCSP